MRKIVVFLLLCCSLYSAEWQPLSGGAMPDGYSVGVSGTNGISGGIPTRTNLIDVTLTPYFADNTGATDASSAIQSAVDANVNTDNVVYLPAGTYRLNGYVTVKSGMTLRGAGKGVTIVKPYSGIGFVIGNDPSWSEITYNGRGTFTASKGDKVLSVSISHNSFTNGRTVQFSHINFDPQLLGLEPTTSGGQAIFWTGVVTSGGGTSTLTVEPPVPFDVVGCVINQTQLASTYLAGIESLTIDGQDGANMTRGIQSPGLLRECWISGVDIKYTIDYPISLEYSHRPEITNCEIFPAQSGSSNKAGLLVNTVSRAYIYNNVITGNAPNIELNFGNYGNIYAYNYWNNSVFGSDANINHGPYNMYSLFEGNMTPNMQADGYFGGMRWALLFRNWITGVSGTSQVYLMSWNKWTRETYAAGNLFQAYGYATDPARWSLGNPNISNADYNGTASAYGVKGELTTRASATAGTITVASGHGVTTGATTDVYWLAISGGYGITYIRRGVTVGTVTSTTIPFSGGVGDDLPSVNNTDFYIPTSNSALWNFPYDWDASIPSPKRWNGTLTTRTNNYQGVITVDSGDVSDMAGSLALSSGGNKVTLVTPALGPITGSFSGDLFTFSVDNISATLPTVSTSVVLGPTTQYNFQQMDMDVIYTTNFYNNGSYYTNGPIPEQEFTDGTTLGNSQYLSSKPDWFGSISWPPFGPSLQPAAYGDAQKALIPAGWRKVYGNSSYLGESSSAVPRFSQRRGLRRR